MPDTTLPPHLARCQRAGDLDDELPPWLGERLRRATNEIFRADFERAQDEESNACPN